MERNLLISGSPSAKIAEKLEHLRELDRQAEARAGQSELSAGRGGSR